MRKALDPSVERLARTVGREATAVSKDASRYLKEIAASLSNTPNKEQLEKQIVPRIHAWLDSIHKHEHRENALLQNAYNTDFGSGD